MNESKKNAVKKNDPRTKAQLIEALNKANDLISEQEKELNSYQKKIEKVKQKIAVLNAQYDESEVAKKEMGKNLQEGEKQQQALRKKIRNQEKSIIRLKEELDVLQHPSKSTREDIPSARTTFRIDFYPRQGHFQGKITHSLTKDDKVFRDLDIAAIERFISQHLSKKKEKVAALETESHEVEPGFDTVATLADERLTPFSELTVIPTHTAISGNCVQHDQPFQVQIGLDLTKIRAQIPDPLAYKISIYAKCLEDGARKITGEISGSIRSADIFTAKVPSSSLPSGTYRLEAIAMLGDMAGGLSGGSTYQESKLINVY